MAGPADLPAAALVLPTGSKQSCGLPPYEQNNSCPCTQEGQAIVPPPPVVVLQAEETQVHSVTPKRVGPASGCLIGQALSPGCT